MMQRTSPSQTPRTPRRRASAMAPPPRARVTKIAAATKSTGKLPPISRLGCSGSTRPPLAPSSSSSVSQESAVSMLSAERARYRMLRQQNQQLAAELATARHRVANAKAATARETSLRTAADSVTKCFAEELSAAERHRALEHASLVAAIKRGAEVLEQERALRRSADAAVRSVESELGTLRRELRAAQKKAPPAPHAFVSAAVALTTSSAANAPPLSTKDWLSGCMFELCDVMEEFELAPGGGLPRGIAFLAAIVRHDSARGHALVLKILNSAECFWRAFQLMAPEVCVLGDSKEVDEGEEHRPHCDAQGEWSRT